MIDIHCHIYPGIDDGAPSYDEAFRMLEMGAQRGNTGYILTPHANHRRRGWNFYTEEFVQGFEEFVKAFRNSGLPHGGSLELYLGMEVYGADNVPKLLRQNGLCSLNDSRYMLVEFEFEDDVQRVNDILYAVRDAGYIPIVAHPERYVYIQQIPEILYDWKAMGCLLQLNRGSILGKFGEEEAYTSGLILNERDADFVASDAHGSRQRTTCLEDAYAYIESAYSREYAENLFEKNPRKVIRNEKIVPYKR